MTDDVDPVRGDAPPPTDGLGPPADLPQPPGLDYEERPYVPTAHARWRRWYAEGRGGSLIGCSSLWAASAGWSVFSIGLVTGEPGMTGCLVVPLVAMAAFCGLSGLVEREADKFFPLAGLGLTLLGVAAWYVAVQFN